MRHPPSFASSSSDVPLSVRLVPGTRTTMPSTWCVEPTTRSSSSRLAPASSSGGFGQGSRSRGDTRCHPFKKHVGGAG